MYQQRAQSPDRIELTTNEQVPLPLEAMQDIITTAQNTVTATTNAATSTVLGQLADIKLHLTHELAALETRIRTAEKCLERIPLQLYNARIPFNCPLQYPSDVQVVRPMPIYKRDIFNLLESDCIITAEALGLPELPGEPTEAQRRAQIGMFLGVVVNDRCWEVSAV